MRPMKPTTPSTNPLRLRARARLFAPFIEFVKEDCTISPFKRVDVARLLMTFNKFCAYKGYKPKSRLYVGWAIHYIKERLNVRIERRMEVIDGPCSGFCSRYVGIGLKR